MFDRLPEEILGKIVLMAGSPFHLRLVSKRFRDLVLKPPPLVLRTRDYGGTITIRDLYLRGASCDVVDWWLRTYPLLRLPPEFWTCPPRLEICNWIGQHHPDRVDPWILADAKMVAMLREWSEEYGHLDAEIYTAFIAHIKLPVYSVIRGGPSEFIIHCYKVALSERWKSYHKLRFMIRTTLHRLSWSDMDWKINQSITWVLNIRNVSTVARMMEMICYTHYGEVGGIQRLIRDVRRLVAAEQWLGNTELGDEFTRWFDHLQSS